MASGIISGSERGSSYSDVILVYSVRILMFKLLDAVVIKNFGFTCSAYEWGL